MRCNCAVNEVLIRLMCERIKIEVGKMIDAGASVEQVNDVLPDVLLYYETWRRETLDRVMREFDDLERPRPTDDGTSLRPN